MILSGLGILGAVKEGKVYIDNFDETKLNPNSYNLTLNEKLLVYKNFPLDMKKENETDVIIIPEEGLLLEPGRLYLGVTNERTSTDDFVPLLEGRSSIARLGIKIHITAGFGDNGFNGKWTLEIEVTHPVRIYPDVEIAQIYYHTLSGDTSIKYDGKYQGATDVIASRLHKDF